MVGTSPRITQAGSIHSFRCHKSRILRIIRREMTSIGELFLQQLGNGVKSRSNLLLENLFEVAGTVGRFKSQRNAGAVEQQCLGHKFEVIRNSGVWRPIEELFYGDPSDGVVVLLKRTEAESGINVFVSASEEAGFRARELLERLIVDKHSERTLDRFAFRTTHAKIYGGRFTRPIGGLHWPSLKHEIARLWKEDAGCGHAGIHRVRLRLNVQGVRGKSNRPAELLVR